MNLYIIKKLNQYILKIVILLSISLHSCTYLQNKPTKQSIITKSWIKNQNKLIKIKKFEIKGICILSYKKKYFFHYFLKKIEPNHYYLSINNFFNTNSFKFKISKNSFFIDKKYHNEFKKIQHYIKNNLILLKNISNILIGIPIKNSIYHINKSGLLKKGKYIKNNIKFTLNYFKFICYKKYKLPTFIKIKQKKNYIKLKINNWKL